MGAGRAEDKNPEPEPEVGAGRRGGRRTVGRPARLARAHAHPDGRTDSPEPRDRSFGCTAEFTQIKQLYDTMAGPYLFKLRTPSQFRETKIAFIYSKRKNHFLHIPKVSVLGKTLFPSHQPSQRVK